MGNMLNSLFGRDWAERSRFYGDLLNCMKISSCRGGSNGQVLHRAFRVSAQVPVLQQVPRILAARRQLCLLSSSTVTAVPSGSSKLAAHPAGAGPRTPPHPSCLAWGISPALNHSFQRLRGTNAVTTIELTHRKNRNAKEREWGEALL